MRQDEPALVADRQQLAAGCRDRIGWPLPADGRLNPIGRSTAQAIDTECEGRWEWRCCFGSFFLFFFWRGWLPHLVSCIREEVPDGFLGVVRIGSLRDNGQTVVLISGEVGGPCGLNCAPGASPRRC